MMNTTIQIHKDTRENLKKFGHKGESYDDIIERLLDYFEDLNYDKMIDERWQRLQSEKKDYSSTS